MEMLPINNNSGQSYGYVVYKKTNLNLSTGDILKISVYGKLISKTPRNITDLNGFGFWRLENSTLTIDTDIQNATMDLVVENFGRINHGLLNQFHQFKGLTDDVYINDIIVRNWKIVPLEFKTNWNINSNNWKPITTVEATPALYKFVLEIDDEPEDTFVDVQGWTKGITIINGFVLGRHFFIGPQQTLYLPAPLLRIGSNDIIVFEHYDAKKYLKFSIAPIFGNTLYV